MRRASRNVRERLDRRARRRHHQDLLLHRAAPTTTASRAWSASATRSPRGVRGGAIVDMEAAERADPRRRARRRADGRRDDPRGHRQPVRRLARLADHRRRGRDRRPRDRRRRPAPRARPGPHQTRSRRPPADPLDPGRLLDRRQPRHPRSARHVRRAARRRHASGHRRGRRGAQPARPASRAAISRSRRWWSSPYAAGLAALVEDEMRPRRHRHRHGRRHHLDRRLLRRQCWSTPTACRSAAGMSPTTSPAACRRRSPMPSA